MPFSLPYKFARALPRPCLRNFTIAALCALLISACQQGESVTERVEGARKRNDGPAIWIVSDHDSTLYLYGSVHLLPDGADWQRRDLQAAFDDVGTVFFEIPDGIEAELQASILQREHGLYQSGERLSDHLSGPNQNRLAAAAYNVDIPPERLETFKPWLVADMLSIAAAQSQGLKPENSVDIALRRKAKKSQKVVRALDSMDTYIKAVALQPEWVQMQALEQVITDIGTVGTDIERVNAAWIVGNTDLLTNTMIKPAKDNSPELYEVLFKQRNKQWSKILDKYMQGDSDGFVVVGIGHLLGEDSLQSHLVELGYDIKRYRRFDLPNE